MIDDHRRALAHAAARRLADLLAEPRHETSPLPWREQSLAKGAAGVAILHGVLASHGHGGHGDARRAHAWLARAAREQLSAGPGVGLWFGVPAVAFAILAAAPHDYRRAAADLDSAVRDVVRVRLAAANARLGAGVRPLLAEFDLVHGLTGLGAYLLRRDPHGQQLRHVLAHLVRLTQPVPVDDQAGSTAPGWWARDAPSPHQTERYPGGHANFGMAHGITGPLALLALAMRRGITVEGHAAAIAAICRWLDTWQHVTPAGPWWPEHIGVAELRTGRSVHTRSARPSWCYGTPGIARAQQLAGIALRDTDRQRAAEHALDRCLIDPAQLCRITDAALCHGWAGLAATTWCAAVDARFVDLTRHLPMLVDRLIDHTDALPGRPSGLIDGSAGVALTLHTIATGTADTWPTCLLLT